MTKQDYINQLDLMISRGKLSFDFLEQFLYEEEILPDSLEEHKALELIHFGRLSQDDIKNLASKAYAKEAADDARQSI